MARFLAIAGLLGLVAIVTRGPDNGELYRRMGQTGIVLDCDDIHCFRPLVPMVLEPLPGPSLVKWKIYVVLTSAAAGLAVGRLCRVLGLSARAAMFGTWLAAFGYGPLQTIFDSYSADPLMYFLGPWLMADLLEHKLGRATLVASIGVLAKEFAAAPMFIYAGLTVLERRWSAAARAIVAALAVLIVWLALQVALMTLYNNSYGVNPSADLSGGGWLRPWLAGLGAWAGAVTLVATLGPLCLLMAAGLTRSGPTLRLLALAALPAAAAFAYVQQPERALWNFHFVMIPIAMLALEGLSDRVCWVFVIACGVSNLRLGESQPPFVPAMRVAMLALALVIAAFAVMTTVKRHRVEQME